MEVVQTLIVIPTYNEAENIENLAGKILDLTPNKVHILFVDDQSPDGTGKIAANLCQETSRVHLLQRNKKSGLGSAYVEGFQWGLKKKYDQFIQMDADFSHKPSDLTTILELLKTNDGVIGSRYIKNGGTKNWSLGRRFLSKGGNVYARLILGTPIQDFTGGFNGWRRSVLDTIELSSLRSDGYSFQIELKHRAFNHQFHLKEFPILFEDRQIGKSKMSRRIILEALFRIWKFR